MNSFEITSKWTDGTLIEQDIHEYLRDNVWPLEPQIDWGTIRHAGELCWDLYQWVQGRALPCSFLEAVIERDYRKALEQADSKMRRGGLWVIFVFLYNCAPNGWEVRGVSKNNNAG